MDNNNHDNGINENWNRISCSDNNNIELENNPYKDYNENQLETSLHECKCKVMMMKLIMNNEKQKQSKLFKC